LQRQQHIKLKNIVKQTVITSNTNKNPLK